MRKFNITIIVMDTMRLDMFKELSKTKGMELSRFGDFVSFDRCIAPSTWTLPSTASLLTGTYASEHGAHETKEVKCLDIDRIKLKTETFVSDLKRMGYKTYAISANPYFHPVYGFDEFDTFIEEPYFTDVYGSVVEVSRKLKPLIAKYRNTYGTNLLKISTAMLMEDPNLFLEALATSMVLTPIAAMKKLKAQFIENWPIEKGGGKMVAAERQLKPRAPFFLLMNFMEPHDPYVGNPKKDFNWATSFLKKPVDPKLLALWKRLYRIACKRCYKYVFEVVKDLIARFGEDQMIILLSDHGQSFNEQGFIGHSAMLYDEVAYVPFAVMLPKGFEKVRADRYLSLVNVRAFISAALKGDRKAMAKLYSKVVWAESFGIPANISTIKGVDLQKMKKHDRQKRRVFR